MSRKDTCFITLVILSALAQFIFVFWLGFPGYIHCIDIYDSLALKLNNWHPVIIARLHQLLFALFGKHTFYLFAWNLICFYGGTLFFILALYLRTRWMGWYALYAVTAIGNFFFQNFVSHHSFTLPMMLWLSSAMLFFLLVVDIKNRRRARLMQWATGGMFLLSLLWRHNAILSIYPFSLLIGYLWLASSAQGLTRRTYTLRLLTFMLLSGVLMAGIVTGIPRLLSAEADRQMIRHPILHQIAGMVVPAEDASLIPASWYEEGVDFAYVKNLYDAYPTFADPFNMPRARFHTLRPFRLGELDGLYTVWLKAFCTYPEHYLRHVSRFIDNMWDQYPIWIFNPDNVQHDHRNAEKGDIVLDFPEAERRIRFSPLRKQLYTYFYERRLLLNHSVGVWGGFILLGAGSILWLATPRLRNTVLLLSICAAMSACLTAVGVCAFSPATNSRYMSPVMVLSLIALIAFVAWMVLSILAQWRLWWGVSSSVDAPRAIAPKATYALSVIMPIYNEAPYLDEIIARVRAVQLPTQIDDLELILVDDGSTDGSDECLDAYRGEEGVRVHFLPSNCGKGAAVQAGLRLASGDILLIQDADLEYSPQDYPALLHPILQAGAEVVYGSRFLEQRCPEGMAGCHRFSNRCINAWTNWLYGTALTDQATGYKLFRAEVLHEMRLTAARFGFCAEVTARTLRRGYRIVEVPINYRARSRAQGKKIRWYDGLDALWTLLKWRFMKEK